MDNTKNTEQILLKIEGSSPLQTRQILCRKGDNLLHVLQAHRILVPAYCGGAGSCGKCGVSVRKGFLPITDADKKHFSEESLIGGMRLSCKAILQENLTISLGHQEGSEFSILGNNDMIQIEFHSNHPISDKSFAIAIDIGTTTLAFSLLDLKSRKILGTHTAINSQRSFGADVISRMQASNSGSRELLQETIKKDLENGILMLMQKFDIAPDRFCHIAIAANTVMMHLLRGYSCKSLSRHPFLPETLAFEEFPCKEFFKEMLPSAFSPKVTLLPGISAFVGADITAGLYACNIHTNPGAVLFLDLGTNGEMVLKTDKKIFAASAAAGPVFEGGNIRYGTGSIPGAISQVNIRGNIPEITTIENAPPIGICGTGAIETAAELLSAKIMDKTGKLIDPYFSQGYLLAHKADKEQILFTQKDIREIQMAKAAIRAGIEILLMRSGISREDVCQVYLAGGFGYFLNIKKAAAIGLLPEDFVSKARSAGNTSLKGALLYLASQDKDPLLDIIKRTSSISLANDDKFEEMYIDYMNF